MCKINDCDSCLRKAISPMYFTMTLSFTFSFHPLQLNLCRIFFFFFFWGGGAVAPDGT